MNFLKNCEGFEPTYEYYDLDVEVEFESSGAEEWDVTEETTTTEESTTGEKEITALYLKDIDSMSLESHERF